jgi:DNA-binding NtrC family response regulator
MKASDLSLLELLDFEPSDGSIQMRGRRMLLWDADAFGTLRNELVESLGISRARPILRRFGFANGYRDALAVGELFSWDNDIEWWRSCPALQRDEGKVKPTVHSVAVDRDAGIFEMEVSWHHSYEAEQHKRLFGTSEAPVCWTLAGYASGFATALMGQECLVIETSCAAMGGAACRVSGRVRTTWGAQADDIARDYAALPLSQELEEREAELRRQRSKLMRTQRELAKLRGHEPMRGGLVCRSREMERVLDLCETVAKVDSTVLITGESGVGKERIARFIAEASQRGEGPYLAVNCGALPESLLESALFGHLQGSFTGANQDRKGLFEAARNGTIFLDEVGEMSPATQVKLLRVLQEREVMPVGSTSPRPIDVRVLAATNRDLEEMVSRGEFRADLYYRLKVVAVEIPALRARSADVLPLAREFIASASKRAKIPLKTLAPEAVEAMVEYHWPGNVRELQNAVERAVVLSGERGKIEKSDLGPEIRGASASPQLFPRDQVVPMAELEKRYVLEVLERFDGNRTRTARALGIGANTLWRKLKSWGVPPARALS